MLEEAGWDKEVEDERLNLLEEMRVEGNRKERLQQNMSDNGGNSGIGEQRR